MIARCAINRQLNYNEASNYKFKLQNSFEAIITTTQAKASLQEMIQTSA